MKKTRNAWGFSTWDKFEMKNIYRNYNEEDLIVAYLSMVEHTGKINDEMREAISQKFDYNEFVKKANFRTALIKEKGRISFEIHNRVQKGDDFSLGYYSYKCFFGIHHACFFMFFFHYDFHYFIHFHWFFNHFVSSIRRSQVIVNLKNIKVYSEYSFVNWCIYFTCIAFDMFPNFDVISFSLKNPSGFTWFKYMTWKKDKN